MHFLRKIHFGRHVMARVDLFFISFLFVFALVVAVWIGVTSVTSDNRLDTETASLIEGDFTITYGGVSFQSPLPVKINASGGDVIVVSKKLDKSSIDGNSIIFYTVQSWVDIFIDDVCMLSSDRGRKTPFPLSAASAWQFIRLPDDFDGKILRIEIEPVFDKSARSLPAVYTGTKASFLYMILKKGLLSLFVDVFILTIGIVLSFAGMFVKDKILRRRFIRLGIFGLTVSLWCIFEAKSLQLFSGNSPVMLYLLYSCFFLLPVTGLYFFQSFPCFSRDSVLTFLFRLSCINFIIIQFLQIFGIFHFTDMIITIHILVPVIFVEIVRSYHKFYKMEKNKEERYIYRAILVLFLFCCGDVLLFYIDPGADVGRSSKLGMLFFFIALGIIVTNQINDLKINAVRQRIYEELAYTDVMTGLGNRAAFEKRLNEYKKNPWAEETMILVADMNYLKHINDNFGHAAGDKALKAISKCLQTAFAPDCFCYRVGGDEFCVIGRNIGKENFECKLRNFHGLLAEEEKNVSQPLSVACGYQILGSTDIMECLKQADELMYADKLKKRGSCRDNPSFERL